MLRIVEELILCAVFALMVYLMSRDPLKALYNWPPKIRKRAKSLPADRDRIPAWQDKPAAKGSASASFVIIPALILRYINGYTRLRAAFGYGLPLCARQSLWRRGDSHSLPLPRSAPCFQGHRGHGGGIS